jgi:hypothetical protein
VQQQYNWFRPADPAIRWIDPDQMGPEAVAELVRGALAGR